MDNFRIEIISAIIVVLGFAVKYFREYLLEKILNPIKAYFKKEKLDVSALTSGRIINNLLMELRIKTKADRASIFLFHNGQHFNPKIINNSIWKFTCAYETCKEGVSYESENMQSLLVTNHLSLISSLWGDLNEGYNKYACEGCTNNCEGTKNIIVIVNTDGITFGNTRSTLESQGTKKLLICPIIIDEDYVGFTSLSYSSNFTYGDQIVSIDKDTNIKGFAVLCEFTSRISFYLSKKEQVI